MHHFLASSHGRADAGGPGAEGTTAKQSSAATLRWRRSQMGAKCGAITLRLPLRTKRPVSSIRVRSSSRVITTQARPSMAKPPAFTLMRSRSQSQRCSAASSQIRSVHVGRYARETARDGVVDVMYARRGARKNLGLEKSLSRRSYNRRSGPASLPERKVRVRDSLVSAIRSRTSLPGPHLVCDHPFPPRASPRERRAMRARSPSRPWTTTPFPY